MRWLSPSSWSTSFPSFHFRILLFLNLLFYLSLSHIKRTESEREKSSRIGPTNDNGPRLNRCQRAVAAQLVPSNGSPLSLLSASIFKTSSRRSSPSLRRLLLFIKFYFPSLLGLISRIRLLHGSCLPLLLRPRRSPAQRRDERERNFFRESSSNHARRCSFRARSRLQQRWSCEE